MKAVAAVLVLALAVLAVSAGRLSTSEANLRSDFVKALDAPSFIEHDKVTNEILGKFEASFAATQAASGLNIRNHPMNAPLPRHNRLMDVDYNGINANIYRQKLAKAQRDIATVQLLYTVPTYPACEPYAEGQPIPSTIMHFNSFGRIHPVGAFTDSEKSKEYFLLACPYADQPIETQLQVSKTVIKRVTSWDSYVWAEIVLTLSVPALGINRNHTHTGYFLMDDQSSICGYKIAFQRLELRDPPISTAMVDASLNARVAALCNTIIPFYNDTSIPLEDQYAWAGNPTGVDCVAFLSVPERKMEQGYMYVDQDSLKCREFHLGLVNQNDHRSRINRAAGATDLADLLLANRDTHLTHSGPRGGVKCVVHTMDVFDQDNVQCMA